MLIMHIIDVKEGNNVYYIALCACKYTSILYQNIIVRHIIPLYLHKIGE